MKKLIGLAGIVLILALGFVACSNPVDNDPNGPNGPNGPGLITSPIVGTWTEGYMLHLTFRGDGGFRINVLPGYGDDLQEVGMGTFAVSGSAITITPTHAGFTMAFVSDEYHFSLFPDFSNGWHSQADLRNDLLYMFSYVTENMIDDMLAEFGVTSIDELLDEMLPDFLDMLDILDDYDILYIVDLIAHYLAILGNPEAIEKYLLDLFGEDIPENLDLTGIIAEASEIINAILSELNITEERLQGINDVEGLTAEIEAIANEIAEAFEEITIAIAGTITDAVLDMVFRPIQGTFTVSTATEIATLELSASLFGMELPESLTLFRIDE